MLHRYKLWVRRTWDKIPVLLSLAGWPPLLSHGLAFILGTLMLRPAGTTRNVPLGRILIPLDRVAQIETDSRALRPDQKFTVLQRQGETWCRPAAEPLSLWNPTGKAGTAYLQWPASMAGAKRLEQLLLKKVAVTIEPVKFVFCGSAESGSIIKHSAGVSYD